MTQVTTPAHRPSFGRSWGLPIVAFVAIVAATLYVLGQREYRVARGYWQERLETAAQTRRDMLGHWWNGHLGSATILLSDPTIQAAVRGGPLSPAVARLQAFADAYGYRTISLLDSRSITVVNLAPHDSAFAATESPPRTATAPTVRIISSLADSVLVQLLIPIPDSSGAPDGTLVLTIDPKRSLFPLLTRELAGTATGQTLLVERVNSDVQVFSPMRQLAPRRLALTTPDLAAAASLGVRVSFGEYVNNGGTAVLAAGILDTMSGWGLIREVSRQEAFHDVRRTVRLYALAGILVVIIGIWVMFLVWRASVRQQGATDVASQLHRDELARRLDAEERGRRFAGLLDSSTEEAYLVAGEQMTFELVNETALTHLQYSERDLLRRGLFDIAPELDPAKFRVELAPLNSREQRHITREWEQIRRDGSRYPVEAVIHYNHVSASPSYFILVRDISDRRSLEQQLRESAKLEAVGRLAGGVAHDFNNILTAIIVTAELARADVADGTALAFEIDEILKAGERAKALTSQLLSFGRRQIMRMEDVQMTAVVTGIEQMLRRLTPENLDIMVSLSSISTVRVDVGMMEQVLTNLIVNAIDAMPAGGRVTIETADVILDAAYARRRPVVSEGRYVLLSVSDTGIGMDETTRSRLFEPFYTTKEKGKGTGLGLSVVHGIVNQFGGHIWLYSEPGQGSTFKVYLPAVGRGAMPTPPTGLNVPAKTRATEIETRTVLFVEDDDAVRRVTARILDAAGFNVLQAENGEQALVVAREHRGPIALLITDIVMPRLGGRALADRMAVTRPGMPVLYLSGFTDNAVVHHGILDKGTHFLQKPFLSHALLDEVYKALEPADQALLRTAD